MTNTLNHPLFQDAQLIMQTLEQAGYEAYFVGGCVRDTLLQRPLHDIDIASSATPEEVQALFDHTIDLGKEHGTIIVMHQGVGYEITTFRTESNYSDHRRPDTVQFVRNLKEDTLRRDFTVNALAFDRRGQLYDYHGGQDDLNQQIIRAVGHPTERFEEDALRMVRAIRFASQLGFVIEDKTLTAIQSLAQNIQYISMERNRVEITKFFQGDHFVQAADLLVTTQLGSYLADFKELNLPQILTQMTQTIAPLIEQKIERSEELVWALFLEASGLNAEQQKQLLRHWTHSNQMIATTLGLVQLFNQLELVETLTDWQVYQYDAQVLTIADRFLQASYGESDNSLRQRQSQLPIQSKNDLVINGQDVIQLLALDHGGPVIGEILDQLEQLVVQRQLTNEKETLSGWVTTNYL